MITYYQGKVRIRRLPISIWRGVFAVFEHAEDGFFGSGSEVFGRSDLGGAVQ